MGDFTFWAAITGLVLFMLMGIVQSRTKDQLARVERKLDALIKHAGIDPLAGAEREIADLLRDGRKIEAIRVYRERSGAGLAEAKRYVEDLERRS